jgi:2-dehydro-3-deoxy-D-gluconate 5-dehydrogenase
MSILQQFSLAGKTALVTGCKRGIGKSIAVALAEAGADIIGVSASLELTGSAVQKEVEATGRHFKAYQADFNDRKALYVFIDKVKAENKPVDILFCNAGTIMRKPAAEHPDEYWDEVINVNLNAQFILSREFGKEMIQRGSGKIVFTASLLSFVAQRCCPRRIHPGPHSRRPLGRRRRHEGRCRVPGFACIQLCYRHHCYC